MNERPLAITNVHVHDSADHVRSQALDILKGILPCC